VFVDVTSAILRETEFGTKVVGSTVTVLAVALKVIVEKWSGVKLVEPMHASLEGTTHVLVLLGKLIAEPMRRVK
jgi:hypothetical protein